MKVKMKRILSILLAAAALMSLLAVGVSAAQAPLDPNHPCTLRILLQYTDENGEKKPAKGKVGYYHIARTRYAGGDEFYELTGYFMNSNIRLDGLETEEDLLRQVPISALEKTIDEYGLNPLHPTEIDESGVVTFVDMKPGLYLIVPIKPEDGPMLYAMNPFLITLPRKDEEGNYDYDCEVPVPAKVQVTPETVDIHVIKEWKNDLPKDRPQSITVELMNGSQVADTAILTKETGWEEIFLNKPADIIWTVQEKKVEGYDGKVGIMERNGNDYEVIITNTPTNGVLKQTGQLNWPVPVLLIGGLLLVACGFIMSRDKKKY